MTPIEAYQLYTALWSHFTSTYDFQKYNGKLKYARAGYEKSKHKHQFNKLAKHPDPMGLVLSNLIFDTDIWVGRLFEEESKTIWQQWKKRQDSLSYEFSENVKVLVYSDFRVIHGQHPNLLHLYLRGKVCIETLVILDDLLNLGEYWNKRLNGDPVWDLVHLRIRKYKPFLSYDKEKMEKIFKKEYQTTEQP